MLIKIRIERQKREKNKKKIIYIKKRNAAAPSSVRKNLYRRITAHNIVPRGRSLRLHDIENIKWAFTMLEEFRNYGQVRWARRAFRQRRCLPGTREENRYEGRVHVISRQKKFPFPFFSFFNRTVDQSTFQGQCWPLFFSLLFTSSNPFLIFCLLQAFSKIVLYSMILKLVFYYFFYFFLIYSYYFGQSPLSFSLFNT